MKFILHYPNCDFEEEIEEESQFYVIQRLLEDWKNSDIDLHGVFLFLEANGIDYGIDDYDVCENTAVQLLENAATDVLQLIHGNDIQELAFMISVSDSVQIEELL